MGKVTAGNGGRVWSPESDAAVAPPNKGKSTKVTLGLVALFIGFVGTGLWFTYGLGLVVSYGLLFFFLVGISLVIVFSFHLRKNLTFPQLLHTTFAYRVVIRNWWNGLY